MGYIYEISNIRDVAVGGRAERRRERRRAEDRDRVDGVRARLYVSGGDIFLREGAPSDGQRAVSVGRSFDYRAVAQRAIFLPEEEVSRLALLLHGHVPRPRGLARLRRRHGVLRLRLALRRLHPRRRLLLQAHARHRKHSQHAALEKGKSI